MKEEDLGFGRRIIGFDSDEEMFAYLASLSAQAQESMEHLYEPQRGITWGGYALRLQPYEEAGETKVLAIFGYIYTVEEIEKQEIAAGSDVEGGELRYMMERLYELYDEGYRYGNWYSTICVEGDIGDAHLSTLWPITEADYHHALNNRWEPPTYLLDRVRDEMREAQHGS